MKPTIRFAIFSLLGLIPLLFVPAWSTVIIGAVVVLLVGLLDFLLTPSLKPVQISRELPNQIRLGNEFSAALRLDNLGSRKLKLHVRDAFDPSAGLSKQTAQTRIEPQGRGVIKQQFFPTRRGEHYSRGVWLQSSGPLGLLNKTKKVEQFATFTVLHPFGARKHLPSRLQRLHDIEGLAAVHMRGQGTEFDSLRDFVDGDDVRSIDWRATARRHQVVVRTWRPERDRQVLIVLDTSRTSAIRVGDAPKLDASIDAALLLTALTAAAGDKVSLLCADRLPHAQVVGAQPGQVLAKAVDVTSSLFPAMVETDWNMLTREILRRSSRGSLVVLLTAIDPDAVEQGLLNTVSQITAQHPVIVASISDPELETMRNQRDDVAAVYAAAAAEHTTIKRNNSARMLEASGAFVIDSTPQQLPTDLSDKYLELKAAGKL